ncbi:NAD-dependent epimerase/dehydratase family protein [Myxococcaceae bacterium GXIMD 01537]
MRIFVTGATGFIGRHLVPALVQAGHEVVALVRRPGTLPAHPGVTQIQGDVEEVDGFSHGLKGMDAVIHAAALVDPIDDEQAADALNHRASFALARAARDRGVRVFIFVSSIAAIGMGRDLGVVDGEVLCAPSTPYGRSKRSAELSLLALEGPDFRVVVARPPTVYGRGDTRGNFLALARAVRTGVFFIPGHGRNRMSFCHVDNLVRALRLFAESEEAQGIFHVADGRPVTLREFAEHVAEETGSRLLPAPVPLSLAMGAAWAAEWAAPRLGIAPPLTRVRLASVASDFAFDCAPLMRLGFNHPREWREATRDTLSWYQDEGLLRR